MAEMVAYLIFIHYNLCLLHMDIAVLIACQQSAMSFLHPASFTQELWLFILGRVLFHTLQRHRGRKSKSKHTAVYRQSTNCQYYFHFVINTVIKPVLFMWITHSVFEMFEVQFTVAWMS